MKKTLFLIAITTAVFFMTTEAKAQSNAIGLRTALIGVGYELSYQRYLSKNRLEFDLGLHQDSGVSIAGLYQWIVSLGAEGLNWYAGAGTHFGVHEETFMLGVAANAGIEYNFRRFPIQLSLDYRPTYYLIPSEADIYTKDLAVGIRYRF